MLRAMPEGEDLLDELEDPADYRARARARRLAAVEAAGGEMVAVG